MLPLEVATIGLLSAPPVSSCTDILTSGQEAAGALLAAPPADPDAERRVDLTRQWVVAIDDSSTTEVGPSSAFLTNTL